MTICIINHCLGEKKKKSFVIPFWKSIGSLFKLKFPYLWTNCAMFGWVLEKTLKRRQYIWTIHSWHFFSTKMNPFHQWILALKIGPVVVEEVLNAVSVLYYDVPIAKGMTLHLHKMESSSPQKACIVNY